MLFLSDMLVGYNCVAVDQFFVFLCHSHSVIPEMCFFSHPSSAFGAIFQSSLFGLAGILPASYTTPIMSGQGLAGTFAAFSMICALASKSHTNQLWD